MNRTKEKIQEEINYWENIMDNAYGEDEYDIISNAVHKIDRLNDEIYKLKTENKVLNSKD